tara:strand:+ start:16446 stop:16643 length:198 start_codon:yes stop_codon:yes gene_type:complete
MVNKITQLEGFIFNLGSKKKNIASAQRKLKNRGFKGKFKINVNKTPKKLDTFVKFKAMRLKGGRK